jgi:hypothetical protein
MSSISNSTYAAYAGFLDGCNAIKGIPPVRRTSKVRLRRDYIANELAGRDECVRAGYLQFEGKFLAYDRN